jgi:hypothetical protein
MLPYQRRWTGFVLFLLDMYFVLSVLLRITVSDINHLVIFKLFLYEGVDRGREPGSKGGGKRELEGKEVKGRNPTKEGVNSCAPEG